MSYLALSTKTSSDPNSAADVNQLQENITYIKGYYESYASTSGSMTVSFGGNQSRYYITSGTANQTVTLPTLSSSQYYIVEIINDSGVVVTSCTTISGATTVTTSDTTGILAGMNVYGNNVDATCTVSTVTSGTTFILSSNANKSETATAILEFSNTVIVDGVGSETIDGLTTVHLPRNGDRIKIQSASTEWKIIDERITCQLILDTHAGYPASIYSPYFTNVRETCGNFITLTNNNTVGCKFLILKSGVYSFSFWKGDGDYAVGFSKNSNQLTTSVFSINIMDILTCDYNPGAEAAASCEITRRMNANDFVYAHTNGAAASRAGVCVSYVRS